MHVRCSSRAAGQRESADDDVQQYTGVLDATETTKRSDHQVHCSRKTQQGKLYTCVLGVDIRVDLACGAVRNNE